MIAFWENTVTKREFLFHKLQTWWTFQNIYYFHTFSSICSAIIWRNSASFASAAISWTFMVEQFGMLRNSSISSPFFQFKISQVWDYWENRFHAAFFLGSKSLIFIVRIKFYSMISNLVPDEIAEVQKALLFVRGWNQESDLFERSQGKLIDCHINEEERVFDSKRGSSITQDDGKSHSKRGLLKDERTKDRKVQLEIVVHSRRKSSNFHIFMHKIVFGSESWAPLTQDHLNSSNKR